MKDASTTFAYHHQLWTRYKRLFCVLSTSKSNRSRNQSQKQDRKKTSQSFNTWHINLWIDFIFRFGLNRGFFSPINWRQKQQSRPLAAIACKNRFETSGISFSIKSSFLFAHWISPRIATPNGIVLMAICICAPVTHDPSEFNSHEIHSVLNMEQTNKTWKWCICSKHVLICMHQNWSVARWCNTSELRIRK